MINWNHIPMTVILCLLLKKTLSLLLWNNMHYLIWFREPKKWEICGTIIATVCLTLVFGVFLSFIFQFVPYLYEDLILPVSQKFINGRFIRIYCLKTHLPICTTSLILPSSVPTIHHVFTMAIDILSPTLFFVSNFPFQISNINQLNYLHQISHKWIERKRLSFRSRGIGHSLNIRIVLKRNSQVDTLNGSNLP